MTRRDFDNRTKARGPDWGRGTMASDERAAYRARRCILDTTPDILTRRMRHIAWRRADRGDMVAVLDVSQAARTVATYRRASGRPLLALGPAVVLP